MSGHVIEYLNFYIIPSCVFLNEHLPYAAIGIFSTIKGVTKGTGKCEVPNAYFKRFMRGDPSDVYIQKCLSLLEAEGYIERNNIKRKITDSNGKIKFETKRQIRICPDYEDKHSNLIPIRGALQQKVLDNSTVIDPPKPIVSGGKKPIVSVNSIVNSIRVSKDTKRVAPSINPDLLFLLEEWRLKEQIPKNQHHPKEGSKIHSKIAMLTNLLLKGKFGAHCDLDPKFLDQCKISKKETSRKFTREELLSGLDEMAEMYKLNNLPEDKTSISKMSFDALIYHPIAKISYLLKYMYTDTKPLAYKTIEVYGHWLDKLYEEKIFDKSIENDNHPFGILKKGLLGIEEYFKWMYLNPMADVSANVYRQIESEDKFFNVYVEWLNDNYHQGISHYHIGPQNNQWWKFIKWLEEAIHGDFVHKYPTLNKRNYEM